MATIQQAEKQEVEASNVNNETPNDGSNEPSSKQSATEAPPEPDFKRGPRFWAIMFALCVTGVLSALEGTVVSTALPTVIRSLGGGEEYLWGVNGYFLSSMCFLPLYGQTANIFGRRPMLLIAVALFATGSLICGLAPSMGIFILGRGVQGTGGGGMGTLINLIICDIVPLRQRGGYLAILYAATTVGNGMGPFIGGIIVQRTTWRWVFWMNLPLAGAALGLLVLFLNVKSGHEKEHVWKKLKRIDYFGHSIFVLSIASVIISLTYAGVLHPWGAWQTLLPLILGFLGLAFFLVFEASKFCLEPTMPLRLFNNRTTNSAFVLGFIHALLTIWTIYFLPIYFQAVLASSPARSGVQLLPTVLILMPFAAIGGKLLQKFGKYRPLHLIGFSFIAIGLGLFTLLNSSSSMAMWVIFQAIIAAGSGVVVSSLLPAAQASLAERDTATATSTFSLIRSFGVSFSVTIPGTLFNNKFNQLAYRISDSETRALLSNGQAYEHATKPFIEKFSGVLRGEVVGVYTDSLKFVWQVAIGIAVLAVLVVFCEKDIPLRTTLKTDYGVKDEKETDEKAAGKV